MRAVEISEAGTGLWQFRWEWSSLAERNEYGAKGASGKCIIAARTRKQAQRKWKWWKKERQR